MIRFKSVITNEHANWVYTEPQYDAKLWIAYLAVVAVVALIVLRARRISNRL